jgi:uncharacterized damage-inducible protein DinB
MDSSETHHAGRTEALRGAFAAANDRLLARLRAASDEAAGRAAGDGWSASQIGWHVAAVTTRFAGLMSGDVPGAGPLAADFRQRTWAEIVAGIPDQIAAPASLVPPAGVARTEAIAALEASAAEMHRALDGLTEERGGRMGITSRTVGGAITVYQIAEWATAHVIRHNRQAKRALGEG